MDTTTRAIERASGVESFAVEAFTLLCVGLLAIGLRTYTRFRQVGIRNFDADDWLMLLVVLPYVSETVLAYSVGASYHGLTNSDMSDEERAALSPDSEEYAWRVGGSKIQIAGWCMYASVLWIIKAALCGFYLRLTAGVNGYRTRIFIGFAFIIASYIALIASFLLSCRPLNHLWQINPNPGNLCQPALSKVYILLTVTLNISSDVYLLFIPLPMLWGARIKTIKKLGLIVLFSGAIFVMVAGLLRCILILQHPQSGPKEGSSWAVRESFVAVTTSCLPMTWGWLRLKLKPLFGSLLSSSNNGGYPDTTTNKRSNGPEPGSILLADRSHGPGWRSQGQDRPTGKGDMSVKDFVDDDASSDEIIPGAQPIGGGSRELGITKEVEFTVSTSKVPSSQEDLTYINRFDSRD